MKQYMVIETYLPGCKDKVYGRLNKKGRMLPEGLVYINSWLEKDGDRCFQLMETNDQLLLQGWIKRWNELVEFEIVEIGEKPSDSRE